MPSIDKINLPDGSTLTLPRKYSEEDAKNIAMEYAIENKIVELPETSDFVEGLKRGYRQTSSNVLTTASEAAGGQGFENVESSLDDFAKGHRDKIEPRKIKNYKEGLESLDNSIDYVQQTIGEVIPSVAAIGASGVLAIGAARVVAPIVIGAARVAPVVKGVTLLAGALGMFSGSFAQSFGEIRQEVEKIAPDSDVSDTEILGATAVSSLDALSLGVIFKPVLGPYVKKFGAEAVKDKLIQGGITEGISKKIVRGAAKAVPKGILVEPATEAIQEGIEGITVAKATDTQLDLDVLVEHMEEAAVMGFIAAGALGTGASVTSAVKQKLNNNKSPDGTESEKTESLLEKYEIEIESINNEDGASPVSVDKVSLDRDDVSEVTQEDISRIKDSSGKEKLSDENIKTYTNILRNQNVPEKEISRRVELLEKVKNSLAEKEIKTSPIIDPELELITTPKQEEDLNITGQESIIELDARERAQEEFYLPKVDLLHEIKKNNVLNEFHTLIYPKDIIEENLKKLHKINDSKNNVQFLDEGIELLYEGIQSLEQSKEFLNQEVFHILSKEKEGIISPAEVKDKLTNQEIPLKDVKEAMDGFFFESEKTEDENLDTLYEYIINENKQYERTSKNIENVYSEDPRGASEEILPTLLKGKLKGLTTPKEDLVENEDLFNKIEEEVKKIAGPKAEIKFMDELQDMNSNPVRGAQVGNLLYVSTNILNKNIEETALHEAFHFLVNSGALTSKDKKLLEIETPRIQKILAEDYGLDVRDLENMGPLGQEELQAELFGKYIKDPKIVESSKVRKLFDKILNLFRKINNLMRGAGFRTFEDLFNEISSGQKSPEQVNQELVDDSQSVRFQKIRDEWYTNNPSLEEIEASYSTPIMEKLSKDDLNKSFTPIQRYFKFLMSIPQIATFSPIHAATANHFKEKAQDTSALMNRFENLLRPVLRDKEQFIVISSFLDHMSATNQKFKMDASGRLVYKNRNNKPVYLNKDISEKALELQEVFKEVPRQVDTAIRSFLSEEFPDLVDKNGKVFVEESKNFKEAATLAITQQEKDMLERKANLLENAGTNLIEIEEIIKSENPYFPQMRFGEYGVLIKNNDKEGKDFFSSVDRGSLSKKYSKWNQDQVEEIFNTIKNSEELSKQYDIENAKIFKLTYNEISNRLDESMITPDLVGSLLGSGSEEYHKIIEELRNRVGFTEIQKHFKPRQNIPGYSKDYERVATAYLTSSARYISNIKYAKGTSELDSYIGKLQDKNVEEDVRKFFNYVTDPNTDMAGIRTLNFMYTMGLNLSTASLQLVTLPTASVSLMMQWNPNFILNNGWIANAFKDSLKIVSKELLKSKKVDVADVFSKKNINNLVNKKIINEEEGVLLYLAGRRNILDPNIVNESLGGSEFKSGVYKRKVNKLLDSAARISGVPIAIGEHVSRISSLLAFYRSLNTQHRINKALKVYARDKRFISAYKRNKSNSKNKLSDRQFISMYALDEAHGIFGKEGRGVAQRGVYGSFAFSFMTHPIQMLELLVRQFKHRGPEGKAAAAYNLLIQMVFFGLMGIPGMELLKELAEFATEMKTGKKTDLFNDIIISLEEHGYDPWTGQFATGGVSRSVLDVDIAKRGNIPIFFQNPAIALMDGDVELRDVSGVSGQLLQSVSEAKGLITQGNYGKAARNVLPVAAKNALKGIYDLNPYIGGGLNTKKGTRLVNPEEVDLKDILLQTAGVTPGIVASRRQALYEQNLQTYGYRTGESKYREKIADLYEEKFTSNSKEHKKELDKEIQKESRNLIAFRNRNGLPTDSRFWAGFKRSISSKLKQRLSPGDLHTNSRHVDTETIEKAFETNR